MSALVKKLLALSMAAVIWCGFTLNTASAQSTPNLPYQLKKVAQRIHFFLQREGLKNGVALGKFHAPKKAAINPGPGMFQILERELRKLKIDTSPGEQLTIDGEFRLHDAGNGKREAELIWKLLDGDKTMFIVNVNLRNAEDVDLFFPRPVVIDGTKVLAQSKSPSLLAAEIIVNSKPRTPEYSTEYKPQMAFVKLDKDDTFAVRLHNKSKFCMAVLLKVDAVNIWAFSGPDRDWRVVVPPYKTVTIDGWHRSGTTWDKFRTTSYSESMRKNKNLPPDDSHVGVITMSYRFCKRVDTTDPLPPELNAGAKAQSDGRFFVGKSGQTSQQSANEVSTIQGDPQGTVIIRFSR